MLAEVGNKNFWHSFKWSDCIIYLSPNIYFMWPSPLTYNILYVIITFDILYVCNCHIKYVVCGFHQWYIIYGQMSWERILTKSNVTFWLQCWRLLRPNKKDNEENKKSDVFIHVFAPLKRFYFFTGCPKKMPKKRYLFSSLKHPIIAAKSLFLLLRPKKYDFDGNLS